MLGITDDNSGLHEMMNMINVTGITRTGSQVSVQLTLKSVSKMGSLKTVWQSEPVTATLGGDMESQIVSSDDDTTLGKYFDGEVALAAGDNGDGRLAVSVMAEGGTDPTGMIQMYLFELTISGEDGTEIDLWDDYAGFGGRNYLGLSGYEDGDSDISSGDWTSTDRVVSVGAYCTNTLQRDYDGTTTDTSKPENEDDKSEKEDGDGAPATEQKPEVADEPEPAEPQEEPVKEPKEVTIEPTEAPEEAPQAAKKAKKEPKKAKPAAKDEKKKAVKTEKKATAEEVKPQESEKPQEEKKAEKEAARPDDERSPQFKFDPKTGQLSLFSDEDM